MQDATSKLMGRAQLTRSSSSSTRGERPMAQQARLLALEESKDEVVPISGLERT